MGIDGVTCNAMKRFSALIILGILLAAGQARVHAAPALSDWPSLNADAAQTNWDQGEHTLSASNVLKISPKWVAPAADTVGYPVAAGRHVFVPFVSGRHAYVHELDGVSGKLIATYTKEAFGGMVFSAGSLYVAGYHLQELDPATGSQLAVIDTAPRLPRGAFLMPLADRSIILAGYTDLSLHAANTLYAFSSDLSQRLWHAPSLRAQGSIVAGHVFTEITSGAAGYDERTGRHTFSRQLLHGAWFGGGKLLYVVGTLGTSPLTLFAYAGSGRRVWSRVVGPRLNVQDWPHASTGTLIYLQTLQPQAGVEAVDPDTGKVAWSQPVPDIQHLVVANNVLYALTYRLGQSVRLVLLRADSGKIIGSKVLQAGYFAFPSPNNMMVANGMVYLRLEGPQGSQLVALGL